MTSAARKVVFQDHGTGIAAADLPHIFERFYRGDHSRTRATGGSGLGLAIAKALVEAYGGSIRADSTPGKGHSDDGRNSDIEGTVFRENG